MTTSGAGGARVHPRAAAARVARSGAPALVAIALVASAAAGLIRGSPTLPAGNRAEEPGRSPAPATARAPLLTERFDDPDLPGWTSETGGSREEERSWKVRAGILEQSEADGLLRVLMSGSATWDDYAVEARVRVASAADDSRAGLIFRDDGAGFYLLRVARGIDRVQLMYHRRQPFGWEELATMPLAGQSLPDDFVRLRCEARGPELACFVDGHERVRLVDDRSRRGRIGLYSCQTASAFDDVVVLALSGRPAGAASVRPVRARARTFWFRETFEKEASWIGWPAGTRFAPGRALLVRVAAPTLVMLPGTEIGDGVAAVRVRVPDAAGRAGVAIRVGSGGRYQVMLDRTAGQVSLERVDPGQAPTVLASSPRLKNIPDTLVPLVIQARGQALLVMIEDVPLAAATDTKFARGGVALVIEGGPVAFADLTVASAP
jgi:hypothetical protein